MQVKEKYPVSQNQAGNNMKNSGSTSTDPIADMLSRIRNTIAIHKSEIMVPHSKLKKAVLELLVENGFINKIEEMPLSVGKMIKITINSVDQNAKISHISRISKPGRRMYTKAKDIPTVKHGRGMIIISTSQGVVTDKKAKEKSLGGELICKVY